MSNVADLLAELGLSQRHVARTLDCSRQDVWEAMAGEQPEARLIGEFLRGVIWTREELAKLRD